MENLAAILIVVIAYLIGAIPFGLIVTRACGVGDIRTKGSGNIGATNVWRVAGFKAAMWVYLLDIGKGVLAVMIARNMSQSLLPQELFLMLVALAAVLGHIFPVYLGFKGGKGVNTGLGVLITLLPIETLIALAVFLIVVIATRYISLGSICAALALSVSIFIEKFALLKPVATAYLFLAVAIAIVVVLTHRQNIRRLLSGTENRFSFSSKADRPGGGNS